MESLQELTIKSIQAHAQTEVRLASLETAIVGMRNDHKELMTSITGILRKLDVLEENQRHNDHVHQIIHDRIDTVKQELDELIEDHSPCKTLAKAAETNTAKHQELNRRITDLANQCRECPVGGYQELVKQMDDVQKTLKALCASLTVLNYKIKGLPLWLLFVFLVLIGAAFDVFEHWQWILQAVAAIK